MFLDGSLPQRKQLLNLYIHRINVFPEQIEILLNNIPSSHLIPTKEEGILSADDGGQDALHKYCYELKKNKPATSKNEMTGLFVVEVRQEGEIPRDGENQLTIDENELDILPIIMLEEKNPLFNTYLIGKKTLKNVYFGGEVWKM